MSGSNTGSQNQNPRSPKETGNELYDACLWLSSHLGFPAPEAPPPKKARHPR